ncbi:MAG: thymidine kinase [Alphaproteobacteria bacterium]
MAKLYFYYSAMNAGKTTTLLQSAHNYMERGMKTLLFTPSIDTRYESGKIMSRIGLAQEAISFDKKFDFYAFIKAEKEKSKKPIKCVLLDEAQFLTKEQVLQLSDVSDGLGIPVLTYGLRTDFLGELFEGSKYLLGMAEELIEIKTICHCGSKATMNARIDETGKMVRVGKQIEIGGNDRYVSLCHKHFKMGQA